MVWLTADWPAPARVRTLISTRAGGVSEGPFASNNLGAHVGDNPQHVAVNRQRLLEKADSAYAVQWLNQVHGTRVVEASDAGQVVEADGCTTSAPGVACAVLTADCLPVLIANRSGTRVAAVHAGWRGLADGVLVAALERFDDAANNIVVYLGPAIGPRHFEVGPEVRQYFLDRAHVAPVESIARESQPELTSGRGSLDNAFQPSVGDRYLADLYQIARIQCAEAGVVNIYGGGFCTYADSERFFSYRRDGQTGRLVSAIWLAP